MVFFIGYPNGTQIVGTQWVPNVGTQRGTQSLDLGVPNQGVWVPNDFEISYLVGTQSGGVGTQ